MGAVFETVGVTDRRGRRIAACGAAVGSGLAALGVRLSTGALAVGFALATLAIVGSWRGGVRRRRGRAPEPAAGAGASHRGRFRQVRFLFGQPRGDVIILDGLVHTADDAERVGTPFSLSVRRPGPPWVDELLYCFLVPELEHETVDVEIDGDKARIRGAGTEIELDVRDSVGWPV